MTKQERKADALAAYNAFIECYPFTANDHIGEQWRPIEGFSGYQVSNFGRVKSFKLKTPRIMKPELGKDGYLRIDLKNNANHKHFSIHRLVAKAFIMSEANKDQINHIDGHKLNNHVSNLEWCTVAENNQHALETGLRKSGGEHRDAKLSNAQAEQIRNMYVPADPEFGAAALADFFGVEQTTILDIVHGEHYKQAGGKIHTKKIQRPPKFLSDEEKEYIRNVHKQRDKKFGTRPLAKKFGVDEKTIWTILNVK